MPLRIKCPSGHSLIVSEARAGQTLRCPKCSAEVLVPGEKRTPAEQPVVAPPSVDAEYKLPKATDEASKGVSDSRQKERKERERRQRWRKDEVASPAVIPTPPAVAAQPPLPVVQKLATLVEPPPVVVPPPIASPIAAAPPIKQPPSKPNPTGTSFKNIVREGEAPAEPCSGEVAARREPRPPDIAPEKAPPPSQQLAPIASPPIIAPPPEIVFGPVTEAPKRTSEPVKVEPVAAEPGVALGPLTQAPRPLAEMKPGPPPVLPSAVEPPPPSPALPPAPAPAPKSAPPPAQQPAPPVVPPRELPPPIVHAPAQLLTVYQLSAAVVAVGLFGIIPSIWDLVEYSQDPAGMFIARWALILGALAAIQIAYALYLIQLPDWTTVWIVTLFSLAIAAIYAMGLGLTLISGEEGLLVKFLQLSDKIAGGKAAMWCLCMMSVMTLLAFFAGRISVRWRQAEMQLREV